MIRTGGDVIHYNGPLISSEGENAHEKKEKSDDVVEEGVNCGDHKGGS